MSFGNSTITDSIFDEDELKDLHVPKAYRLVGLLRLVWVIVLVLYILYFLSEKFKFSNDTPEFVGNMIGVVIVGCLVMMSVIYHAKQLKEEITLSQHIIAKRKYRMLSIIMLMLFSFAALAGLILAGSNIRMSISLIFTVLLITAMITILIIDLDFYIKLRKKN